MKSGYECQFLSQCEKLGVTSGECCFAAQPREQRIAMAACTYNAPAEILPHPSEEEVCARLELLESDINRLQTCVASLMKLAFKSPNKSA